MPEITTDPNSGTTVGLMAAFLNTDSKHQIDSILAPDINVNSTLGAGATFRYFAYPSEDTQWFVVAGGSQKIATQVEADYGTGLTRHKWWSAQIHFMYERDPTERFFGIGNNSSFNNQTNYTTDQIYSDMLFGWNITENFQLAAYFRPRWLRIQHGGFSSIPSIGSLFPNVKGLHGGSVMLGRLMATYDTRDSIKVPTRGTMVSAYAGGADRVLGSSVSYNEFGFDARHYLRLNSRMTLAGHVFARYVTGGNETPFWEMSWLGGDGPGQISDLGIPLSNESTWRGYGAGRYIDNNLEAANLELRTKVYEADVFNTHGTLEVAPFVDIGRVFHYASQNPLRIDAFHPAGGLGFRAIALPFVVGFLDFGYGADGLAVFSGVNYPF
ncbi:MAG: BamA/TamA family outer membrane protein [Candidatus Binataceae bacterium]|nr:BamA/TamA family outer membrane protein [Candidatus Binataceae bacterium]